MLNILIILFVIYTLYKEFLSLLELNFVKQKMQEKAVILGSEDYQKAGIVTITNQKFAIFSHFYELIISLFWILVGLKLMAGFFDFGRVLGASAFALSFLVLNALFHLPLGIYETFVKDKKLGFSNTSLKTFITDNIKSLALLLILGFAVLFILVSCFKFLGDFWWVVAFGVSFALILLVNLIYPTLIAPLFNKMSPLENGELKASIEDLLSKAGFKSSGVFVVDASKRDKRLNAYFGGLGSTKRVVLFDTLINALSKDEILAVLGHELGHFKHGDIIKNLALMSVVIFIVFAVFGNIPNSVFEAVGLDKNGGSIIVILMLFSSILLAFFEPVISYFSRLHEFGADDFGASIKDKTNMIEALKKLGSENKAFPLSHPVYSAVYHSHPTLFERINELEKNH